LSRGAGEQKGEKTMKVIKNGNKVEMEYGDICKELGFVPESHFVEVTTRGSITFTVGKPDEIKDLYKAVVDNGYKASAKLVKSRENL
jgi:hypothetical protein